MTAVAAITKEKDMNRQRFTLSAAALIALLLGLAPVAEASIPEPDVIYYGTAAHAGTNSVVTLKLNNAAAPFLSGVVGADLGYVLRVPMDSLEPRTSGTAHTGDTVEIFVDNVLVHKSFIPARGSVVNLTLSDAFGADQWAKDHSGDNGSGDKNRNGIADLQEFLDGKDPAACVWSVIDETHAETTVYDMDVFRNCLKEAGEDGVHNTIRVAQGTYAGSLLYQAAWGEHFDLDLAGGYDPSAKGPRTRDPGLTVLDGDSDHDGLGDGRVLTIDTDTGQTAGAVRVNTVHITNGSAPAGEAGGGILARAYRGNIELTDLIVSKSKAGSGGGIAVESTDAAELVLANTLVYANSAATAGGVKIGTAAASGPVTLLNNTLADNAATTASDGKSLLIESTAASVDMTNNIVSAATGTSAPAGYEVYVNSFGATLPVEVRNNDIHAPSDILVNSPMFSLDPSNTNAAPLFVDAAAGNYHLLDGSVCIDAGMSAHPLALASSLDIDGAPRTIGAQVDMGADEAGMDGNLNNDAAVDILDVLKALRIAAGLDAPTPLDLTHADVAPLVNGRMQPDGTIDLSDVVVILRRSLGLPTW